METIIKKQEEVFKEIKGQNNLLLGFIGILLGIIFSTQNLSKDYLIPYMGIIFSFSLSLYGFYLSTNFLSDNPNKNKILISSLTWLIRFSISFLFVSVLIFSYILIGGLK